MIEAIQVAAEAAQAANPAVKTQVTQPQATAIEVHQFSDAYTRASGTNNVSATSETTSVLKPVNVQETSSSAGFRALAVFGENLNGGASEIQQLAQKLSSGGIDANPSVMMEMTMACHQFMFKAQVTSNVANRTSDGIQQLFRQQS